jgi:hypothetical protein
MILGIIQATEPSSKSFDQIIRDCIFFREFESEGDIKNIYFGSLSEYVDHWESYIHNLYYINFCEMMFDTLLSILKQNPFGATIEKITSAIDNEKIIHLIENKGLSISENPSIREIEETLLQSFSGRKSSLKDFLNEKTLSLDAWSAKDIEKRITNLLLLVILLKNRYSQLNPDQKKLTAFEESNRYSIIPRLIYNKLIQGEIKDFIHNSFEAIKNRHRLVSARKYFSNSTKAWLITEEEKILTFYGRDFSRSFYREAKWRNIIELLIDMGLVTVYADNYSLTRLGEEWINKII